jgi:hypothetical protein
MYQHLAHVVYGIYATTPRNALGVWGLWRKDIMQLLTKAHRDRPLENGIADRITRQHTVGLPTILAIDRSRPFDPEVLLGNGWSIIKEEQDKRSLPMTELNLSKIELIRTMSARDIQLDGGIFLELWENQDCIPKDWKLRSDNSNTRYVCFDGTPLQSPHDGRFVLCLY